MREWYRESSFTADDDIDPARDVTRMRAILESR